jgi:hypothetical protein
LKRSLQKPLKRETGSLAYRFYKGIASRSTVIEIVATAEILATALIDAWCSSRPNFRSAYRRLSAGGGYSSDGMMCRVRPDTRPSTSVVEKSSIHSAKGIAESSLPPRLLFVA